MEKKRPKLTHTFLTLSALLICIGVLFVYSASSVQAVDQHNNAQYFLKRHLLGVTIGILTFIVIQWFSLETIIRYTPLFFLCTFILTTLTLIPQFSIRIHGAARWLHTGIIPIQPSELLKCTIILLTGYMLHHYPLDKKISVIPYLYYGGALMLTSIILLRQPDFGALCIIGITLTLMFYCAHISLRTLAMGACIAVPAIGVLIIRYPYRIQRIMTFLNPWADPHGHGFQIIQSMIAIGSGGICGRGLAASQQKFFYLPMQQTDFIISIVAEEIGLIGCSAILLLYLWWTYIGFAIAAHIRHTFARFTVTGIIILLTIQTLMNIAMATGLIPTKGVGLPFISYGNSALVTHLSMLGLIVLCAKYAQKNR